MKMREVVKGFCIRMNVVEDKYGTLEAELDARSHSTASMCEWIARQDEMSAEDLDPVSEQDVERDAEAVAGEGYVLQLPLQPQPWQHPQLRHVAVCATPGGQGVTTRASQMAAVLGIKEQAKAKYREGDYVNAHCLYAGALELLARCSDHMGTAEQCWEGIKNNIALCELKRKNWIPVVEIFFDILRRNPSNAKALYRRGVAQCGHGKLDEAQGDFKAALVLDPRNVEARRKLAGVLQQTREQQVAARELAEKLRGFLRGKALKRKKRVRR